MRKICLIIIAVGMTLVGCSTMTKEEKAAEAARVEQAVADSLSEGHFKINVNWMMPLRGGAKNLSYGYYVKVDGNQLDSYLPYFGEVRYVPYGGGKGLNFEDEISYYTVNQASDRYEVVLSVTNEEDTYLYYITIFPNATASISVRGRNRDAINYRGELDTTSK